MIFRRMGMCPVEDDVLEKTAAKSNPGNSRGVASMSGFVTHAPYKSKPIRAQMRSTFGNVPHQEVKSPRVS